LYNYENLTISDMKIVYVTFIRPVYSAQKYACFVKSDMLLEFREIRLFENQAKHVNVLCF
jgi:hypothetical protein